MLSKESSAFALQFKDEDGIIGWWLKNIKEASGEYFNSLWESFPEATKKVVANQLKMAALDIAEAQLSITEVEKLLAAGGVPRFIDALLESVRWPDTWKTPYNFKRNLIAHIADSFREQYDAVTIERTPVKPRIVKNPVSDETIRKKNPFTRKSCSICGGKIYKNNATGICTDCQLHKKNRKK